MGAKASELPLIENPIENALVLAGNPSTAAAGKISVGNFGKQLAPMATYGAGATVGFLGANWFRANVTARLLNATWKNATPGGALVVDVLLQLFLAWQLGRRFKGIGKAIAAGIVVNSALAVGKHFMQKPGQPSRFDVVVFTPTANGSAPPAPVVENGVTNGATNGVAENGMTGIGPTRRMGAVIPAARAAA